MRVQELARPTDMPEFLETLRDQYTPSDLSRYLATNKKLSKYKADRPVDFSTLNKLSAITGFQIVLNEREFEDGS